MNIVIDGKTYQGTGQAENNRLGVVIMASISDALGWDKDMVVTVDSEEYHVSALRSIGRYDEQIRVEWECETEATRLERELEEKEEELAESTGMLNRIRDALADLGTGIPTITKLMAFLNVVKEALHE